jgi:hypothetical protein
MKVFAITVAYCPASLLARSLMLYARTRAIQPYKHIVALCGFPIDRKKNENDIRLICEAYGGIDLIDLGGNIGSAQSQNEILRRIDITEEDFFINLDADSACLTAGWDKEMLKVMRNLPDCALISCMAPMVKRYLGDTPLQKVQNAHFQNIGIPFKATPFNLSMWRYSFVKEIGGIPQGGIWWGETEGPFYGACQSRGKYHAYLLNCVEDENGKFMQPRQQNEWKDLHLRVVPEEQFSGNFEEFLRWKYPSLSEIDTAKDFSDHNHR